MPTDYKRKTDRGMAEKTVFSQSTAVMSPDLSSCNLVGNSRSEVRTSSPVNDSTTDERPLTPVNRDNLLNDSRTPSPSILNLPASPPSASQISFESEDEPNYTENRTSDINRSGELISMSSPDLLMSEVTPGTSALPLTTEAHVQYTDLTFSAVPVASTSRDTSVMLMATYFSPETLRPLPKAPPRKGNQTNRRKVKSAILTDTPVKDELAAIEAARTAKKKVKNPVFEEKKSRKRSKPETETKKTKISKKKKDSEDEDDAECLCICCFEPYSNSKAREKWVQCLECKAWAHEACTAGELSYVCHNCLSD